MSKRISAVCVLTLLGMLSLTAGTASAVTIGSDLGRAPNVGYGCESMPGSGPFGERLFLPTGAASCTYLATPPGGPEISQAVFPGGILTSFSVRAGPVTGPMQATILRATRSSGVGFACCLYAASSQVFVPAPNAVTTVPVRLPMRNDINTQFGETVDYLALTVLAPGVPIPMQDLGGGLLPGAMAFFPFVRPGDNRVDGAGLGGMAPLIQGQFTPVCSGRAAGIARARKQARTAGGGCLIGVTADRNRALLRGGRTRFTVICNAAFGCVGTVRLQTKRTRGVTLASSAVNIAGAGTVAVKPKLTRRGKILMAGVRKRRVWLNAILADSNGAKVALSTRITLKR